MKTFKKIVLLALAVVMVFSMVACNEKPQGGDQTGSDPTPKPTPALLICDVDATQLNNYYVSYNVTDVATDGTTTTKKYVEVSYSGIILTSADGGATFTISATGQSCFSLTDVNNDGSVFSRHLLYSKDQLENQGTENVAGVDCTHYFFKNGLIKYHLYVDESFGTTGMNLKFVDEKMDHMGNQSTKTIVVEKLLFDVIDKQEGYSFDSFNLVTPEQPTA